MPKKCIICGDKAVFSIKDTSDYYCEECAHDNFSEISLLQPIEERAKSLKQYVDEVIDKKDDDEKFDDDENEENSEEE